MCLKIKVLLLFTSMPTVAFLLNPSAFTASYKQLTKNYKIDNNIMMLP